MSAVKRGQLVTLPDLPGRWSVWDKAGGHPGGWFLVPVSDAARDSGFTYVTARFRSVGGDVLVQLLATAPTGRLTVPGQYRDAEFHLATGQPTKDNGRPKALVFYRSPHCVAEGHDCGDCMVVTDVDGRPAVCNCPRHQDKQIRAKLLRSSPKRPSSSFSERVSAAASKRGGR